MRTRNLVAIAAILSVAGSAHAAEDLLPIERAATDASSLLDIDALTGQLPVGLAQRVTTDAAPVEPAWLSARELHAIGAFDAPVPLLPDDGLFLLFDGSLGPFHVKAPAAFAVTHGARLTPRAPSVPSGGALAAPYAPTDITPAATDSAAVPDAAPADGAPVATFHPTHVAAATAPAAPNSGVPPTAAAAIATVAGASLLALAGMALYHRIRPNSALENDTRKSIFDAVCGTPGLGVHAIAESAGVSYSTATYHLERLQAAGMIVMTPDGNKLCYYKNGGAFTESERRILPLLKNDEAIRLFEAILTAPGTYRAALAEQLGVTATTINWHLKRLREAGLVHETRHGRNAYLYPNTQALQIAMVGLSTKIPVSDEIVVDRLRRYAAFSAAGRDASASS